MLLRYSLLVSAISAAMAGDFSWITSETSNLCGGIIDECTDAETCTLVGVGPCEGATIAPDWHLQHHFIGAAFVDKDNYLDCLDETDCNHMIVIEPTGSGYRDLSDNEEIDGNAYAYTMAGSIFGTLDDLGGYLGVASFLSTGEGKIKTNVNEFYVATEDGQPPVFRDDSSFGAPDGPFLACISPLKSDGTCGDDVEYPPGSFKFSVFGYTAGQNYPPNLGEDGYPSNTSHLGIRMKVETKGNVDFTRLLLNGVTMEDAGTTDITHLELTDNGDIGVKIDFPQTYNVGSVANAAADGTVLPVALTNNISIKVHKGKTGGPSAIPASEDSFYIDYLFEYADLDAVDTYFAYDPTVTYTDDQGGTSSSVRSTTSSMVSFFIMSLVILAGI